MATWLKKLWFFIWHDDSLASWIANVIIAFLLVKFIIYPALGFMLGTTYPVVAVVSSSMEHEGMNFEEWWTENKAWYEERNITQEDMKEFRFTNGFNKGDIMVLYEAKPSELRVGEVLVYATDKHIYPIIHRVTNIKTETNKYSFETKGDNNNNQDPERVTQEQVLGKAVLRIPWLGWVKIIFTELIGGI